GRPAQLLRIVDSVAYAIGVDIGHSHIMAMLCDASGRPLWNRRIAQAPDLPPRQTLDDAAGLVREGMAEVGIEADRTLGIGVCIAAPVLGELQRVAGPGIMPGWVGVRPAAEL